MTARTLRHALIAFVASAGSGVSCDPAAATPRNPFETFADSLRAAHALPAVAIAVVRADTTLGLAAVGRRRIDRRDQVTLDDYWHLASVSKGVSASLVGVLVDRGLIRWTTTIGESFPEMRDSIDAGYRNVTVAQLLAHTGGVRPYNTAEEIQSVPRLTGTPTDQRLEFLRQVLQQPPGYEPGSAIKYSNAGYTIAGAMAERAAGKPWERMIEEDLMQPMGVRVVFGYALRSGPDQPSGHIKTGSRIERLDPEEDVAVIWSPPGRVTVTIGGYATFMRAHLAGLSGRDGVLKASTVRTLHTAFPPIPTQDTAVASALGWGTRMTDWGRIDGHTGSSGLGFCKVQLLVDQNLGLLVCTNVSGGDVATSVDAIVQSLRQRFATSAMRVRSTLPPLSTATTRSPFFAPTRP